MNDDTGYHDAIEAINTADLEDLMAEIEITEWILALNRCEDEKA